MTPPNNIILVILIILIVAAVIVLIVVVVNSRNNTNTNSSNSSNEAGADDDPPDDDDNFDAGSAQSKGTNKSSKNSLSNTTCSGSGAPKPCQQGPPKVSQTINPVQNVSILNEMGKINHNGQEPIQIVPPVGAPDQIVPPVTQHNAGGVIMVKSQSLSSGDPLEDQSNGAVHQQDLSSSKLDSVKSEHSSDQEGKFQLVNGNEHSTNTEGEFQLVNSHEQAKRENLAPIEDITVSNSSGTENIEIIVPKQESSGSISETLSENEIDGKSETSGKSGPIKSQPYIAVPVMRKSPPYVSIIPGKLSGPIRQDETSGFSVDRSVAGAASFSSDFSSQTDKSGPAKRRPRDHIMHELMNIGKKDSKGSSK